MSASGNTSRTSITVYVYADSNYGSGSGTVKIVDSTNTVLFTELVHFSPNYSSPVTITTANTMDTDLTALLYIGDNVVATAAVVFAGLSGGDVIEINNYSILFNAPFVTGDYIWLHNNNTRSIDNANEFLSLSIDSSNIATTSWSSIEGLSVNASYGGEMVNILPGNKVYVYTSSDATSATTSFTLLSENQYIDIPLKT